MAYSDVFMQFITPGPIFDIIKSVMALTAPDEDVNNLCYLLTFAIVKMHKYR